MHHAGGLARVAPVRVYVASLACVAVLLGAARPGTAQDGAAAELEKLQGAWTVTGAEENGRPQDAVRGGTLLAGATSR